jgi:hypothetical protein
MRVGVELTNVQTHGQIGRLTRSSAALGGFGADRRGLRRADGRGTGGPPWMDGPQRPLVGTSLSLRSGSSQATYLRRERLQRCGGSQGHVRNDDTFEVAATMVDFPRHKRWWIPEPCSVVANPLGASDGLVFMLLCIHIYANINRCSRHIF